MSSSGEEEDHGFAYSLSSYTPVTFKFGEHTVIVKCQKELCFTDAVSLLDGSADYTGQLSWKGSQLLCHYLASTNEAGRLEKGQVCVELGCGSGLASIIASKTGCPKVIATDGDPAAVTLASLNFTESSCASTVEAMVLHWSKVGALAFVDELASKKQHVGLVIASEVIYAESSVRPLLETVAALLASARQPGGSSGRPVRFVLVHAPRSMKQEPVDRALFAIAKELGFADPQVIDLASLQTLITSAQVAENSAALEDFEKREAADIGHSIKQLTRDQFSDTKILIFHLA